MNKFVERALTARATLKRECGLDELDYQLLILEAGCRFLEDAVRSNELVSEQTARAYREHLMAQGFWDWFLYRFCGMETELVERWSRKDAVMLLQDTEYKREHLIEATVGLRIYDHHWTAFDTWLSTVPKQLITKPKHEHVIR